MILSVARVSIYGWLISATAILRQGHSKNARTTVYPRARPCCCTSTRVGECDLRVGAVRVSKSGACTCLAVTVAGSVQRRGQLKRGRTPPACLDL